MFVQMSRLTFNVVCGCYVAQAQGLLLLLLLLLLQMLMEGHKTSHRCSCLHCATVGDSSCYGCFCFGYHLWYLVVTYAKAWLKVCATLNGCTDAALILPNTDLSMAGPPYGLPLADLLAAQVQIGP